MPKNFVQELAQKITDSLPEGIKDTHAELERKIKTGIEQTLSNIKFVKYEEFELQQKILLKTREKLELLEKRVNELEVKSKSDEIQE